METWKELRLQLPDDRICGKCIHTQILPTFQLFEQLQIPISKFLYCPEKQCASLLLIDSPLKAKFHIWGNGTTYEEYEHLRKTYSGSCLEGENV